MKSICNFRVKQIEPMVQNLNLFSEPMVLLKTSENECSKNENQSTLDPGIERIEYKDKNIIIHEERKNPNQNSSTSISLVPL